MGTFGFPFCVSGKGKGMNLRLVNKAIVDHFRARYGYPVLDISQSLLLKDVLSRVAYDTALSIDSTSVIVDAIHDAFSAFFEPFGLEGGALALRDSIVLSIMHMAIED